MNVSRRTVLGAMGIAASLIIYRRPTPAQSGTDLLAVAETLSGFEVNGQIDFLYNFMHADSMREVPRYAVDRWYRDVFLPTGPSPAISTSVRYVDWTWAVNGLTYSNTAEVSYVQSFADGSVVEDVVRLVHDGDGWKWFFGRSRVFIDEQIELGRRVVFPSQPTVAPEWAEQLSATGADAMGSLPRRFQRGEQSTRFPQTLDFGDRFASSDEQIAVRYVDQGYSVSRVSWISLGEDAGFAVDFISQQIDYLARFPAFAVTDWDLLFRTPLPFAHVRAMVNDAVGAESYFFLGAEDRSVWMLNAGTRDDITDLAMLLVDP